jgi:hypothetical protein
MVFFARSTLFFIKRFMEIRTCKKEKGLEKSDGITKFSWVVDM